MSAVKRLLVANRGEIARRVFRTCRAQGIQTVAVFSDPDARMPFVREADAAVHLPGSAPSETYLRSDLVIAAALAAGADAVHPGYGFLSENASFAADVLAAGLTWVGPPPGAIELMGSKLRAKELMTSAGVPCLPTWMSPEEVDAFPVLVKASAGGGGRGMRVVRSAEDLGSAFDAASREALSAFGDGTVFLERYVERPRHVEVQVMADQHDHVVALFERDCSIQRRHQKVVEEAPSPAVTPSLRKALSDAAVAAARAVAYEGAGTVEFVLSPEGEFFFLEMNTRLQVEHPVTELVTGLDLVALQLTVARGEPLPAEALVPVLIGHAVEARLYAEDPSYLPQTGTLIAFDLPDDVRVDAGVEAGSVVGTHYDAMLAKVVAHGATREEATARLASALDRARLHGVVTNRDLLVGVLRSPEWAANEVDTGFLDRFTPASAEVPREHLAAAALCAAASRAGVFPSGWRSVPSQPQTTSYGGQQVQYAHRRDGVAVQVDGEPLSLVVWGCSPSYADLSVDGVRRRYDVALGETTYVDSPLGHSALVEDPRFPLPGSALAAGSLVAPMPGTVLRVAVEPGDDVKAGDALVVLEAMKMEHGVRAVADGRVEEVLVTPGQQVDAGAVLAVVTALE
ncbi:MAG TPA: biotin carboxylase N-terminal domain-containing protein [Mycobacteriales bacterium]|nr:biotin carboxylase N-terminal domain-containing protein [Mycobacteriales bacterium]